MSFLKPKMWQLQCAHCLKVTIVIREVWDWSAKLLCGFNVHPSGSKYEYLGRQQEENEQFLTLCPSCADIINGNPYKNAFSTFCTECFRPLLMVVDTRTNTTQMFGGKAEIFTIGGKPLVREQVCNTCAILSTLYAGG